VSAAAVVTGTRLQETSDGAACVPVSHRRPTAPRHAPDDETSRRDTRGGDELALIAVSAAFRRSMELGGRVAPTDAAVFITGESGVGKEMIAQLIHRRSPRVGHPLVAVNCAAMPENLFESEMFGHVRGAFTGAERTKPGLLEVAAGGTMLLDEITELAKPLQAKLLRVLEDGIIRRVGSERPDATVNVRFIAATNRDPTEAVETGQLREDLFYRLHVVPIHVPALRERPEDIPPLADHFLSMAWPRHRGPGEPQPWLGEGAVQALCAHSWPGNVRELQNVIERAAVLAEPGAAIGAEDLTLPAGDALTPESDRRLFPARDSCLTYHAALEDMVARFQRDYLVRLLARVGRNISAAARAAGVDRSTLYRLMERHGLAPRPDAAGWEEDSDTAEDAVA
jgi:transcriptional regulator with PAS, ATPase and Fis domain